MNADGSPVKFIGKHIEEIHYNELEKLLKPFRNHPIVFVACPPCQPFTNLGTCKRHPSDSGKALAAFTELVIAFRPRFVIVENVPGIRSEKYGTIWSETLRRLKDSKYIVHDEIINAKYYGVPQTRRRMLLLAGHKEEPPLISRKYGMENFIKVKDVLCNGYQLAKLRAGEKSSEDPLHVAAKLSALNLRRIKKTPISGGSRTSWSDELQLNCYKNFSGYTDIYGRMDWNKPAPTLTTRFNSLSNGRFGHPEEDRAITPREGALLQTFPMNYIFSDPSVNVNVRHIGNAVPPLLAKEIISAIKKQIDETGCEHNGSV